MPLKKLRKAVQGSEKSEILPLRKDTRSDTKVIHQAREVESKHERKNSAKSIDNFVQMKERRFVGTQLRIDAKKCRA